MISKEKGEACLVLLLKSYSSDLGISFRPNSTTLDVRITLDNNSSTKRLSAKLLSSKELPLNAQTNVRLEAFGRDIYLFLNNSFDSMISATKERHYGNDILYTINPLADDFIIPINSSPFSMTPITSSPLSSQGQVGAFNGTILKLAHFETKIVPANFSLSFNIKPTGNQSSWSNVIHLVGVGEKESIAAVYFHPGSAKLMVTGRWANIFNWNECLNSTQSLPLITITNVRVEVLGPKSYLFLNNTYHATMTSSSIKKDNQPAILYVSDPWIQNSKAEIDSIELKSILVCNDETSTPNIQYYGQNVFNPCYVQYGGALPYNNGNPLTCSCPKAPEPTMINLPPENPRYYTYYGTQVDNPCYVSDNQLKYNTGNPLRCMNPPALAPPPLPLCQHSSRLIYHNRGGELSRRFSQNNFNRFMCHENGNYSIASIYARINETGPNIYANKLFATGKDLSLGNI